ncbi:MAG TPA: beta-glucosidase [Bacteroidetes bacterium]|nr:beta-glucosidase [Bacteroidota bacterium]
MPFFPDALLRRADFGPDFEWGVATAAYQIEGAWKADGKGPSVWDHFTHRQGKIKDKSNGDIACDFYHRYPEDLALMRKLHLPNYRFSLAWSRIFPEGKGKFNEKGLAYYDRVIDASLENGVQPWLTLYHWDMPQALEALGGWTNRDVIGWFGDYVDLVTTRYADRVKDWMVLNEPMAFTALGYGLGIHAPGRKGWSNFLKATHHASMCQADGARIIRANVPGAQIGSTFSASHIMPVDQRQKSLDAAKRMDALLNRLFLEPALGLGYPIADLPALKKIRKYFKDGDEQKLAFDFDFTGLQNYTREIVKKSIVPYAHAMMVKPKKRGIAQDKITEMGWEVYPEGIYHLLKKIAAYPQIKKIIITENGAAFPDQIENNQVHDPRRKQFIQDYLGQVLRAKKEGIKVAGYFVWSFMDNFEWAEGYQPRFGLVHVDFNTQKRTVKDSGKWFSDFLQQ